ncbi:MAG: ABC transporter ATP-binding protein, partial [Candidatus Neomarinimicrobiota bacterium]
MADALITLSKVVKQYPMGKSFFTALQDINLTFQPGEFAGVVGPSGSGKTTLLNLIGTLDAPTSGDVRLLGRSVVGLNGRESARIRNESLGFIFQTYNLLPVYTVFENVELPLLLLKLPAAERKRKVEQALEWVGLTDKARSKPNQLSGGESQRVAVARAMVKEPPIVLADEPTANLDSENSHHILQTMQQLNRNLGTTFLFSTHDEKVISYLE